MKSNRDSTVQVLGLILLVIVVTGALVWANYRFAKENPGGNDFLVHWVGTRAFFIDGLSPYSDEVAIRIQTIAYGRPAQAGEHELRVAYPLYSTFVFGPFALISDFALARAIWMTILEISIGLITYLSLQLTRWRPSTGMLVLIYLFAFLWYHSFRPLINGNAVILVTLWIVGAFLAIQSNKDELAGFLLGLATIKPQVIVLLFIFVLWWAATRRRWKLVLWMVGTVVILSIISTLLLPPWILENLREVIRYPGYNPPGTPGAAFAQWWPAIGKQVGWVITFLMAILLLLEWLAALKKEFRAFLWTACLTLVASQWIGIQTDPGNFIVLLIPLILVFSVWGARWKRSGLILTFTGMLLLFVGIWALFLTTIERSAQPVQSPVMFFPLPAFVLFGLYWIRWWAIQPPSLWVDLLMEREET